MLAFLSVFTAQLSAQHGQGAKLQVVLRETDPSSLAAALRGSEQLVLITAFDLLCFLHSSISHSVLSEMQMIEQETPLSAKSSRSQLDLFDDVGTFASGPPK